MDLESRLTRQLEARKSNQSFRTLSINTGLVDFISNDYLGLARSVELQSMIGKKTQNITANGATGSRLLSGNSAYIEDVERMLARILKSEKALIFNSGFTANLAVLSTLPQRGDTILYDELCHACIKDGARLSLAKRYSFKHNDLVDLENKLKATDGNTFVAVESVYSMDGDACPLDELVAVCNKYQAHIILDEAHTTGISGPKGSGLSGALSIEEQVSVRIYTFGKAMGIHGAAIACSQLMANYLINFARPFIYTTAPSPHSVASINAAFEFLIDNLSLQDKILERIKFFNNTFNSKIGDRLKKIASQHPVQAIIIPGNDEVKKAAHHLQNSGYDVRPIMSPTVKEGEERLRICLHTFNSDEEISGLIDSLATLA